MAYDRGDEATKKNDSSHNYKTGSEVLLQSGRLTHRYQCRNQGLCRLLPGEKKPQILVVIRSTAIVTATRAPSATT